MGLHIFSDALIALADYCLPLTLFYLVHKRRDLPFNQIFLLLSVFIVASGTTHLLEIWTLWYPTYWLSGGIKLLTAIVSIAIAISLIFIVPKILHLPSPTDRELTGRAAQPVDEPRQLEPDLMAHDIADYKQAETALRESENRFQVFMDNSPTAAWITDATGRVLYLSQTYLRLIQIPADAIGKTIFELFDPEIAELLHRTIQQVVETGQTVEAIEVAPRPDGTLGKFLVYKFPLYELSNQCAVGGVAIDLTEREQAREQLRSLTDRLQYLLTNAPVAIFSCKAEDGYETTSMSENIRTLLGYEPRDFVEDSRFWADHIHPGDRDAILESRAEIFVTGQHTHEYRFLHADGAYRWVYNQLQLLRDELGNPIEIIGYLVDISDRKQAEAAIYQSEARYRAIVQDQTELIARFQPNGTLTFANDAYCRYFGVKPENLIGHHYEPIAFAEDRERVAQLVGLVNRENPTFMLESRVIVGGEVRWTQWVNRALFDSHGQLAEIQTVGRDITDRKQAEQALQEREAFLRAIGDNIPNGYLYQMIRELDGQYRYTYVSAGIEQVSGLKPEAVLADPSLMFQLVVEEDLPYLLQKGEESAQNLSVFDIQVREQLSNGEKRWLHLCSMPRQLDDGRVIWDGIRLDINDLKQTEASLRQSEERWQLAVSGSNDGIWDHNLRTNEHYLSPRCLEIVGYEYDEVDTFDKWFQHIHPDDAHTVQTTFQAHVDHRLPNYTCEYRMRCQDGSYKWMLARGQVLWDEHGTPLRAVGSLTDISDRKRAEEVLRRYERIVSATTDAIALVDRICVYQVVNQTYLNWYNKRSEEVIGHSASDILLPEVFEKTIKPRISQCLAGQVVQYEMWVEYPTLGPQFLSITYDPYYEANQSISGVVISLRNITRLKQAEMELELQGVIVRNIAEGVCMVRVDDGVIVYANPKFERMFGYTVGELKGHHVSAVNYSDGQVSAEAMHREIVHQVGQQGEATYEIHNVKKDGTLFWCRATTSIFEHPEYGTVLVSVQQDITEQKQAAEQIQSSLREKEVLLKEIHHRVKNNLGIVDGLLQMQSRRSPIPQVIEALKASQNRIASIALVHEKLYSSRDLAKINFTQYISDLTAHLFDSYNIHTSQITLTTQIDPISLDIDTAIPCGLIINELVSNSLKYAFSNNQTGEIQVSLRHHQNNTLTLTVRDNGNGLPQNFNLKQTKTLGITLVKGLANQLKGTLEVHSHPGTAFSISFDRF
ncbi:MAG: PAS domain S-box protein [Kovacikia sp.]